MSIVVGATCGSPLSLCPLIQNREVPRVAEGPIPLLPGQLANDPFLHHQVERVGDCRESEPGLRDRHPDRRHGPATEQLEELKRRAT